MQVAWTGDGRPLRHSPSSNLGVCLTCTLLPLTSLTHALTLFQKPLPTSQPTNPQVADLMAAELRWGGSRRRQEVRNARAYLATFKAPPVPPAAPPKK